MLFNSFEYLFLFLPVAFIVFQFFARSPTTEKQIIWLAFASLVFYASWEAVYLLLIAASIVANFALGRMLARGSPQHRRAWLFTGISFNLGLLGYFKYTGFFLEGLNALGQWLIPIPEITLPLAISFFTFQQIAYLVDVYRGQCREYQFHHYALFVLFFPQLIAGPIVHHKEMMPQFERVRDPSRLPADIVVGLSFIGFGLFKKVIMADSLGLIVDPVFDAAARGEEIRTLDALLATFGFSFQIYFDFSGYSDIAIGSARMFGIRLPENFRSPYKSRSVIEIWRRWHMTLSRFLRDYLYIGLGGNRHGVCRRYRNLMITMLLGGLWHGAAWTFVLWGGLHGMYLCVNHAWRALVKRAGLQDLVSSPVLQPLFLLVTFTAWALAFVLFRAADLGAAWSIVYSGFLDFSMQGSSPLKGVLADSLVREVSLMAGVGLPEYSEIYLLVAASAAICWLLPCTQELMADYSPVLVADKAPLQPAALRWKPGFRYAALTACLFSVAVMGLSSISRFIYFQF